MKLMRQNGVTLIELLVVLTILSILAFVVVPLSWVSYKRSKETELRQNLREIRSAIDEYKKDWDGGKMKRNLGESGYPPNLKILVEGVDDVTSAQSGMKIRFLRRIPRDPVNTETSLEPENTWGLRSYQSEPDDPREGDDVYDVYSKSEDKGIDGTFYKNW